MTKITALYGKARIWILAHVGLSIAGACAVSWLVGRVGLPF